MAPIEPEQTLTELVLERPGRTRIFEELQLDYCCGGGRTLAAAAAQHDLDVDTLAVALEAAESAGEADSGERDWSEASLTELCDHIVDVHHAFLRSELPRISDLLAKVAAKHGRARPALKELETEFAALHEDLIEHIDREEEGVFLLCRSLDADDGDPPTISPRLGMHEAAHAKVGQALATIRELAGGYRADGDLCTSHRVLLESLNDLERDLHIHIHEENNLLFPRLRERLGEAQAPVNSA
jgi:regulator of cell morphogenesis and NO signaling